MILSGINVKTGDVWGRTAIRKQGKPNTFKNTPEDDLDTFCDIFSHLTLDIYNLIMIPLSRPLF